MVQGAVRRALRDIQHQRIPLRCSNGHHECRSPAQALSSTSGTLEWHHYLRWRRCHYRRQGTTAAAPWLDIVGHLRSRPATSMPRSGHRASPTTSMSHFHPHHRSTSCAPTPTSPQIAAAHSHPGVPLGQDSSPPRRGRFPASESDDKGRSGPICPGRPAPMAGVPWGRKEEAALGRGAPDGSGWPSADEPWGGAEQARGGGRRWRPHATLDAGDGTKRRRRSSTRRRRISKGAAAAHPIGGGGSRGRGG